MSESFSFFWKKNIWMHILDFFLQLNISNLNNYEMHVIEVIWNKNAMTLYLRFLKEFFAMFVVKKLEHCWFWKKKIQRNSKLKFNTWMNFENYECNCMANFCAMKVWMRGNTFHYIYPKVYMEQLYNASLYKFDYTMHHVYILQLPRSYSCLSFQFQCYF